jgi:hypothetical protein
LSKGYGGLVDLGQKGERRRWARPREKEKRERRERIWAKREGGPRGEGRVFCFKIFSFCILFCKIFETSSNSNTV